MYQVEDEPVETTHLYIVREEAARPSLTPIILSLLGLSLLIVLCVVTPDKQPVTQLALRLPAVPLAVHRFSASVAIIPTGVRTYPATTAHGFLTITNGSVIAQVIPAGFTVQGVATDRAVYVPAGSADGYGKTIVPAHALVSGNAGNLPSLAVNTVIGSSVYIRNLSAFTGGQDAYSVKYVTEQNRQTAAAQAHNLLQGVVIGLHYPCLESITTGTNLRAVWVCQFVTYRIPGFFHVTGVRLVGKNFLLDVWFFDHPQPIWVK